MAERCRIAVCPREHTQKDDVLRHVAVAGPRLVKTEESTAAMKVLGIAKAITQQELIDQREFI